MSARAKHPACTARKLFGLCLWRIIYQADHTFILLYFGALVLLSFGIIAAERRDARRRSPRHGQATRNPDAPRTCRRGGRQGQGRAWPQEAPPTRSPSRSSRSALIFRSGCLRQRGRPIRGHAVLLQIRWLDQNRARARPRGSKACAVSRIYSHSRSYPRVAILHMRKSSDFCPSWPTAPYGCLCLGC